MWEAAPCVALQFLPDGFLACALTDGTVGSLVWKTREPEKLELQVEQSELLAEKIGSSIYAKPKAEQEVFDANPKVAIFFHHWACFAKILFFDIKMFGLVSRAVIPMQAGCNERPRTG